MQSAPVPGWANAVIPVLVLAVVFTLRFRRMKTARPLRVETLWVVPAIYLALVVFVFAKSPPTMLGWTVALVALIAGSAVGWQRGRMMHIEVDPQTHALSQRSSPAAILLLLGLVVIRMGARAWFGGDGSLMRASAGAMLLTDGLLGLALGLLSMTRLEMALRARRLLAQARA